MKRILLVEDDPALRRGLEATLESEHYQVRTAADGGTGFRLARDEAFDLVLLDLMLPVMNGEDVCRELRRLGNATPIVMLTSKGSEADKVVGLEMGADDYVTKPFSVRELLARIRAVLRRAAPPAREIDTLAFDDVQVDFRRYETTRAGAPVHLSAKEYELLRYLAAHEGDVVSRERLLDDVWGYNRGAATRTIDTFVLTLRKKLEQDPAHPRHLLTVHAAGYKFVP